MSNRSIFSNFALQLIIVYSGHNRNFLLLLVVIDVRVVTILSKWIIMVMECEVREGVKCCRFRLRQSLHCAAIYFGSRIYIAAVDCGSCTGV